MSHATSNCARRPGLCTHDPRCEDTNCPGRPAESCSACAGGRCQTPQACVVPESTPRPRMHRPTSGISGPHLPRSRAGWGRAISAALGLAGAAFILGAVGRHFGVF